MYGRSGQRCHRCAGTIGARPTGDRARTLYWCPDCQVRFDPRIARDDSASIDRHPATKFLDDLPWRRTG